MKGFNFNLLDEPSEHGFMPNMVCYILDHNHEGPRPMVLICPGGGYWCYAEHQEGERTAMAYLAAGYNAALVRYRVRPHKFPDALHDLATAIRICREHAEEWHINPHQIVVCGFSAGGHLAASVSTLWNNPEIFSSEEITSEIYRPDASVLCYPVITSGEKAHKDSFINLIGSNDEHDQLWELLSLEKQVDENTPPAFLWHTFEDKDVPMENSIYYASALRDKGVPCELHIYTGGPHGMALVTKECPRTHSIFARNYNWISMSIDWISDLFGIDR